MNIKELLKKLFPDKVNEIDGLEENDNIDKKNDEKRDFKNEEIELLKEQNKVLLKQINELKTVVEGEKTTREETLKNIRKDKINELLENAVAKGKITPENKTKWSERLEKDFEGGMEIIKELPESKVLTGEKQENKEETYHYKNDNMNEINMQELENAYR